MEFFFFLSGLHWLIKFNARLAFEDVLFIENGFLRYPWCFLLFVRLLFMGTFDFFPLVRFITTFLLAGVLLIFLSIVANNVKDFHLVELTQMIIGVLYGFEFTDDFFDQLNVKLLEEFLQDCCFSFDISSTLLWIIVLWLICHVFGQLNSRWFLGLRFLLSRIEIHLRIVASIILN